MTLTSEATKALYLPPECKWEKLNYEKCLVQSTGQEAWNEDWEIVDVDW